MMKPLAVALLALLALTACDPVVEPVETQPPVEPVVEPVETPTVETTTPDPLPADAYLRINATAHLAAGGDLDLVLTIFEPTPEAATPPSTITAIADGCALYNEHRAHLESEPGVDHYYSVASLEVRGDGSAAASSLAVIGLGMDAGAEEGSAVFIDDLDCSSYVHAVGSATLYGYFSTFGFDDLPMALEWQFPGFSDASGPAAANVTFDNCVLEFGEHALAVTGGAYNWSLRDEGWRCAVAPDEYE